MGARRPAVAGFLPGFSVSQDLRGLLDMEGLSGLIILQRRALQIHAEIGCPDGTPPERRYFPMPLWKSFRISPGLIGRAGPRRSSPEGSFLGKAVLSQFEP